jgi:phosphoribosylformimino-5-aminoimidazole carboxamide ribotide isomerase
MKIIPVIDLKDGQVVSAQHGQRETYCPLRSTLCNSSSIEDVLQGFLSVYPFKTLYIADLNAITNTGSNQNIIDKVVAENLNMEFWVDNGIKIQNITAFSDTKYRPIIGSEYQTQTEPYPAYSFLKKNILSLDFFPETGYMGPKELINNPDLWPQDIIIMSLEHVGQNKGPDIQKLAGFCQKHPDKNFIAAGGIRHEKDLLDLRKIGVNHALIASALHSETINAKAIKKLISITP